MISFLYVQWISSALEFPYPVMFFRESVAGGRVKQSPRTLHQLEALAAKSVEIASLYHPPRSYGKI